MQVLARYPNARWSDGTVFYAVANWLRSKAPGVHDLTTGEGMLVDQGACANASECCGHCNTHDLAKSGINATGALAVLNLWSCDTGVQQITRHDAATPGVLHYNATWIGLCDTYRGGDGRYFLEGLASFLDDAEEWLFDAPTRSVLRTAPPAASDAVRGRVSDYALLLSNASNVLFANMSFVATTLSVAGDVANITLAGLEFNYSSVARRSLGEIASPTTLAIWREGTLRPQAPSGFVLDDVIVRYSDGPALLLNGDGSTLRDSLFEWNDFTGVGGSWPAGVPPQGKAARATTLRTGGRGLLFERLSFRNNGAAQAFSAGGSGGAANRVEMCDFQTQLSLQDDGSFVEGGGVPATVYVRNWATDSGKGGLRWDGYYGAKPDTGGLMLQNVVWNASQLVIKGDAHNVTANTVFDGADTTPSHAMADRPRYQDHTSALDDLATVSAGVGAGTKTFDPRANAKSNFAHNVFDFAAIIGAQCPKQPCALPGTWSGNLIGANQSGTDTPFDIRAELRDPYHRDFRPCPRSLVANRSAGAYPVYSPSDATYWLPGRRERIAASSPLPPSGSIGVHRNTDLIFRPARAAVAYSVWFGAGSGPLQHLKDLDGGSNVVHTTAPLDANAEYRWRVDSRIASGTVVTGAVWHFATGNATACEIVPHPPKSGCAAAEDALCPGEAGKGDACRACVLANSPALQSAGCFVAGSRHTFIEGFCYRGARDAAPSTTSM